MAATLGGRPSQEITTSLVLTIFRIQPYIKRLIEANDPGTGGGSPDKMMEQTIEIYDRISESSFKNDEHQTKIQKAKVNRHEQRRCRSR